MAETTYVTGADGRQPADPAVRTLEACGIDKSFGGAHALSAVDFAVAPGEIHALLGMNGAGKSTLVEIIAGSFAPDRGELRVDGVPVHTLTPRRARSLGIATVHQRRMLAPELSVAENVMLGRLSRGVRMVRWQRVRAEARAALQALGVEVDVAVPAGGLTPAEQTLIEIAREVRHGGRVLILDEPTAALGGAEAQRVHDVVRMLARQGVAVVYISHHLDEVLELADRVTVLRDGCLAMTADVADLDLRSLVVAMVGDEVRSEPRSRSAVFGAPVLDLVDVALEGRLNELSLTVHQGEVVGVLGPAGDGQSLLFPILSGLRRPGRGEVRVDGLPLRLGNTRRSLAHGVRCVPSDRLSLGLVPGLPVDENLLLAKSALTPRLLVRWRHIHRAARAARERYDIVTPHADPPVDKLSGGNQQKVLLAKWLETDPRACLLEEPTTGVDVGARAEIYALVDGLAERGAAVLLASSDVDEVMRLADRVVVVRGGQAFAERTIHETRRDELVALTAGGQAT